MLIVTGKAVLAQSWTERLETALRTQPDDPA
jgi:hypothetical protein